MKKLIFLLLITAAAHAQVPGEMIKDIVFKTEKQLTAKYGKPKKEIEDLLGIHSYTLQWTVKGQTVSVFYTDQTFKQVDFITLSYKKFNDTTFHKQFGWDKPITKLKGNSVYFEGLKGVSGWYELEGNFLIIKPDKPDIKTFGKKA